ncbi:MAG: MFS transporter [Alphaproteobacteria bacterium]
MSETAAESRAPKTAPKRALFFIMAVIFLDTVGFGIIAPVLPQLIADLNGSGISDAARIGGWLMVSYALVQFIFAPIIGNLSDRFGRRPVLLFSLLAFGIDYIFMGFAPTLMWLFVGRIIAGIAGGSYVTANAYIADISDDEVKARNFGYIGAAWGLGFIVGPMIGGILGGELGVRAPFFAAAGLVFATLIFGFFALPESLPPKDRRAFSWGRANTFGALLQIRHYPIVVGLLVAMFFYMIAHDANPSVWSYYTPGGKIFWGGENRLAGPGTCRHGLFHCRHRRERHGDDAGNFPDLHDGSCRPGFARHYVKRGARKCTGRIARCHRRHDEPDHDYRALYHDPAFRLLHRSRCTLLLPRRILRFGGGADGCGLCTVRGLVPACTCGSLSIAKPTKRA